MPEGFNHRATTGYVTDGANDVWADNDETYPTNKGGVDFGWASVVAQARDRNSGVDARLAGTGQVTNNGTQALFVVNTGNGTFDITLALGDAGFAQKQYAEICDVNTSNVVQSVLFTVANGAVTPSEDFVDAGGTTRTSASDWVSNNAVKQVTVASGRLGIRLGSTTSQADNSTIAHLSFNAVGGSIAPLAVHHLNQMR